MQTKFWQGTNFWVALGMAVGSIWGLTSEDISPIVSGVFGITGGLFAAREKIKSAVVDWVTWIKSPNTWNFVMAAVVAAVPVIPAGIGPKISELVTALIGKNLAVGNHGAIVYLFHAVFYHHGRGKEKDNSAT
jgi:hypothetical protein